jgi:hypothetical protein
MKSLEKAYLEGWQDAADVITSKFEDALRGAIDSIEVPNFGDEDDKYEESQSKGSDV